MLAERKKQKDSDLFQAKLAISNIHFKGLADLRLDASNTSSSLLTKILRHDPGIEVKEIDPQRDYKRINEKVYLTYRKAVRLNETQNVSCSI